MQIHTDRTKQEIKQHGTFEFPVLVSHERLSNYERKSFLPHWHSELEWTYILEGDIQYQVNGQIYSLTKGSGILCNSNALHAGYSGSSADCHYLSITVHPRLIQGYSGSFLQEKYGRPLIENPAFPCFLLDPNLPWAARILNLLIRIDQIWKDAPQDLDFQIYLLLLECWHLISCNLSLPEISQSSHKNAERLKILLTCIHEHYAEKLTLDTIASSVGLCSSECCRFFKSQMQITLFDYLLSYRIEQSLTLLTEKEISITEIAETCGFSSPSYYSRLFREHMGCTPNQYRKSHSHQQK